MGFSLFIKEKAGGGGQNESGRIGCGAVRRIASSWRRWRYETRAVGVGHRIDATQGDLDARIDERNTRGIQQRIPQANLLAAQMRRDFIEDAAPLNGRVVAREAHGLAIEGLLELT